MKKFKSTWRTVISALLMFSLVFSCLPVLAHAEDSYMIACNIKDTVESGGSHSITSLYDGTTRTFSYDMPKDGAVALVFFSAGICSNSTSVLQSIAASRWLSNPSVRVLAIESSGATREYTEDYIIETLGNHWHDKFDVYYSENDDSLMWDYAHLFGTNHLASPLVVIISQKDGVNYIRYYLDGKHDAALYGNAMSTLIQTIDQSDIVTVSVAGAEHYEGLQAMTDAVNARRSKEGVGDLVLDAYLTEYAMQRAAEASLLYSHLRPNGEACLNGLMDAPYSWVAENLLYTSQGVNPQAAVSSWMSSPGHRANILRSNFNRIGIGCFVNNGMTFWVQTFGQATSGTAGTVKDEGCVPKIVPVETYTSHIFPTLTGYQENMLLNMQEPETMTDMRLLTSNETVSAGWSAALAPVCDNARNSSGTVIAKFAAVNDGKGSIRAKACALGEGTATLKAYEGAPDAWNISVKVLGEAPQQEPMKLLRMIPKSGKVFTGPDRGEFSMSFNYEPNLNFNWHEGGAIEFHDYDTGKTVLRIDDKKFINLGGSVHLKTVCIPDALDELPYGKFYVTISPGLIDAAVKKDDGTIVREVFGGLTDKSEWNFQIAVNKPLVKDGGLFKYHSSLTKEDASYSYSYDEHWFLKSSRIYQHNLARMSIRMALAGVRTDSSSIRDLMEQLEFRNLDDHFVEPGLNTIGYIIGSKNLEDSDGSVCTLISVVVRGGGYKAEWGGNFIVGLQSEHQGFSVAASQVTKGVSSYIKKYAPQGTVKIWITGYSRGAATTNLTAQRLNAMAREGVLGNTSQDDIFAYCFACPRNVRKYKPAYQDLNSNIFSIVNYIDLVPKVAPAEWDFNRYGITYYLPAKELSWKNYERSKWKATQQFINIAAYSGSDVRNMSEIKVLDKYVTPLALQGALTSQIIFSLASYFNSQQIYSAIHEPAVVKIVSESDACSESDLPVDAVLAALVGSAYLDDFRGGEGALVTELLAALPSIRKAHFPELYMAWLDALDGSSEYSKSPRVRYLYVNCPVNVELYSSDGTLAARIENDTPDDSIDSNVAAYVDGSGQKVFVVPADEEYQLQAEATGSGEVTYTIEEIDVDSGNADRVVSYYDVGIETGDALKGTIENLEETESAAYSLYLNDKEEPIKPTVDQKKEQAVKYTVNLTADGAGKVYGGGSFINGEYTKLRAIPDEGAEFNGWYENGVLLSAGPEYRLRADRDYDITAVFTKSAPAKTEYEEGTYEVGTDIPAGEYVFLTQNESDLGFFKVYTDMSKTDCITYELIEHSSFVAVKEGQCLEFKCCLCKPADSCIVPIIDASRYILGPGMYRAGTDIPAGRYSLEINNADLSAHYDIYPPERKTETHLYPVDFGSFNDQICITIEKGQYLELVNCTAALMTGPEPQKPCDGGENCPSRKFVDAPPAGHWAHEGIDYVVSHGLFGGTGANTFEPDTEMTRGMLVTVLWRYEGKPKEGRNHFIDVPANEWFAEPVAWAAENEIVNGVGYNRFDPNGKVTREQMAAILYRYAGKKGMDISKQGNVYGFPDRNSISGWAAPAFRWAVGEKLIGGSDGKLLPQGYATRAQVAAILMRFIKNVAEQ